MASRRCGAMRVAVLGALACPCATLTDYSQPGPMRVGWRNSS